MEKSKEEMQMILKNNNMGHLKVIDKDNIQVIVDGELVTFNRKDEHWGNTSGLAHYGSVSGDWRMIHNLANDIGEAFNLIT